MFCACSHHAMPRILRSLVQSRRKHLFRCSAYFRARVVCRMGESKAQSRVMLVRVLVGCTSSSSRNLRENLGLANARYLGHLSQIEDTTHNATPIPTQVFFPGPESQTAQQATGVGIRFLKSELWPQSQPKSKTRLHAATAPLPP